MLVRLTLMTVLLSLSRAHIHVDHEHGEIPEDDMEGRSFTIDLRNRPKKLYTGLAGTDILITVPILGRTAPDTFALLKGGRVVRYNKVIKIKSLANGGKAVSVLFQDTGPGDTGAFTLKMTNKKHVVRVFDFLVKIITAPLQLNGINNTIHRVEASTEYNINVSIGGSPLPIEFSVRKDGTTRFKHRGRFRTSFTKFNASTGVLQIKINKISNAFLGQYAVKITNEVGSTTWFGFSITAVPKGKMEDDEDNQYLVLAATGLLWAAAAALVIIGIVSLVKTSRSRMIDEEEFEGMEDEYYDDDGLDGGFESDFELQVIDEPQRPSEGERHTSV